MAFPAADSAGDAAAEYIARRFGDDYVPDAWPAGLGRAGTNSAGASTAAAAVGVCAAGACQWASAVAAALGPRHAEPVAGAGGAVLDCRAGLHPGRSQSQPARAGCSRAATVAWQPAAGARNRAVDPRR